MSCGKSKGIHKEGSGNNVFTYYPIIVIGAGETGIAMGCQLKQQLGFDQFRIFERQSFLGGTWYSNKYPGVRCDIPAIFYSFSFAPNYGWSTFHPPGPEILNYLAEVAERYEITDKIQYDAEVTELKYLEKEKLWEATVAYLLPGVGDLTNKERRDRLGKHGTNSVYIKQETLRAKIAVSAVGGLVEPNPWPNIPGLDTFQGDYCHTARWNEKIDFADKDVIVLGTGCSAAQAVPALVEAPYNAKSVTQLMRTPPWVMTAKLPFGLSKSDWEKWTPTLFKAVPGLGRLARFLIFFASEIDFLQLIRLRPENEERRKKREESLLLNMKSKVPQEYWEILTPNYSLGCKRRITDDGWLDSLRNPKIELTTQPLESIQAKSVTLGKGRTYPKTQSSEDQKSEERTLPADVIVFANGFEVTTWLHPLKIVGRSGRQLQDVWDQRGGPQAYLGMAMDDFPNAFILFGPNTATGHSSVILASENMINYSIKFIKMILDGDVEEVEVKKEAEVSWTEMVQEKLKDTVYQSGSCVSWYKVEDGWNATTYPFPQSDFTLRCMFPKWRDWTLTYTRQGRRRLMMRRSLTCVAFVFAILTGVSLYQKMIGLTRPLPGPLGSR